MRDKVFEWVALQLLSKRLENEIPSTLFGVLGDHGDCRIGSHRHGLGLPQERRLELFDVVPDLEQA
jgi:hypothetical protein